jgi:hypothetical protein
MRAASGGRFESMGVGFVQQSHEIETWLGIELSER